MEGLDNSTCQGKGEGGRSRRLLEKDCGGFDNPKKEGKKVPLKNGKERRNQELGEASEKGAALWQVCASQFALVSKKEGERKAVEGNSLSRRKRRRPIPYKQTQKKNPKTKNEKQREIREGSARWTVRRFSVHS